MQGLGTFLTNELQVRLPHVRADEGDLGDDFWAHGGEESLKGCEGAFLAHPEQAGHADLDLVHQGQVFVAFGVLDFIDADERTRLVGPFLMCVSSM
jgi:hypothetical protein